MSQRRIQVTGVAAEAMNEIEFVFEIEIQKYRNRTVYFSFFLDICSNDTVVNWACHIFYNIFYLNVCFLWFLYSWEKVFKNSFGYHCHFHNIIYQGRPIILSLKLNFFIKHKSYFFNNLFRKQKNFSTDIQQSNLALRNILTLR